MNSRLHLNSVVFCDELTVEGNDGEIVQSSVAKYATNPFELYIVGLIFPM